MALKLFRRHTKTCIRKYAKEDRIYQFDSAKTTGRAQCECPIAVDGKLGDTYLKAKATGEADWNDALLVVREWENAGRVKTVEIAPTYEAVTVDRAVESFFMIQRNKGISEDRVKQYSQLLTTRLIPFAEARSIDSIQQTDNALFWAEFRNSWRNENPLRNKKLAPGQVVPEIKIGKRTASRMISDLRIFLNHCVSNRWHSENWATKKHGMITTKVKDPKEPFSDQDVLYIYRAAELLTDGKGGGKNKRTRTQNGFEALVFAFVLRYTGLRISDVVMLKREQLVPFRHGIWTHAISCFPIKTSETRSGGNHVLIPIPSGNLPGHPNVVAALESLPLKHGEYFFLGGGAVPPEGTEEWRDRMRYATNGWRERIDRLFKKADQLMKAENKSFSVHPHPHRFRHTFCAWLLRNGVSLRTVASYIGDTEETVRAHYGKFCVAEQIEAAKTFGDAVLPKGAVAEVSYANPWQRLLL